MKTRRSWSVFGILFTSAFYGVLYTAASDHGSWAELGSYFARLFSTGVSG
jgi:hypothetical protein